MSLDGNIGDFALSDLFQLMILGSRTGQLRIDHSGEIAIIYFSNGQATYASLGDMAGDAVVYEVFNWRSGEFKFDQTQTITSVNIETDTQNLVMEAIRQLDEWAKFAEVIPNELYIVGLSDERDINVNELSLSASDWRILSAVDGISSVADIANAVDVSLFKTTNHVYDLINAGILRISSPTADIEKQERKGIQAIRGFVVSKSGGEDFEITSNVALFALFVNTLLDDFDKPSGLYNAIKQDKVLGEMVADSGDNFPEISVLTVDENNRFELSGIESKLVAVDNPSKDKFLVILNDIKEKVYETAVKQSNKTAAARRHDKIVENIFKGERAPEHLGLQEYVHYKHR